MRVRVGDRSWEGAAVDLPASVDPDRVVRAVRGEAVDGVAVAAPDPTPAHEYVGAIDGGTDPPTRAALAAAARTRGELAPQDRTIAECERRLADLDPPSVDATAARRRVAELEGKERRLDERVAELRGRVQTLRAADDEAALAEAEDDLAEATAELTDVRTDRIAAEQTVERAQRRAREARDVRERRLALEDRIGNLRRAARAHLADAVRPAFDRALAAVPGGVDDATGAGDDLPEGVDGTTVALAVARVADLRAPVVLDCGRFGSAEAAREVLDAPAIRVGGE